MATVVIIHGFFGGGWQWQQVRRGLQAAGHEVYGPTLTGMGERSHLASPDIDLDTHVQDEHNVLAYEELHDVILVGNSYGARWPRSSRTGYRSGWPASFTWMPCSRKTASACWTSSRSRSGASSKSGRG